jgi:two-component system sensor histidine kinase CpxA
LLARAPLKLDPPGSPVTLVLGSDTLSAGGLFVDLSPLALSGLAALILSIFFWLPLVRSITHSIARLRDATVSIAEGKFDVRVDEQRRDELGTLGSAINTMSERLAGLVHGQRRFLSDVAHELCAPIARLQVALGILEARANPADRERLLDLREEVDHMAGLVNELLSFSRAALGAQKVQLGPVNVLGCLEKAIRREAGGTDRIEIVCPPELTVRADVDLLQRVVGNLVRNAIRYAGDAGPITVTGSAHADEVRIDVADCGPGVPPESLNQLFDPFYRVDTARTRETGGLGLGLTIAKTCVASCRGTILAWNRQPSGLCVSVRLERIPDNIS